MASPDYDDLIATLNGLESQWPDYETNGLPPKIQHDLNDAVWHIDNAKTGVDTDGLTGAVNILGMVRQEAQLYPNTTQWIADLDTVVSEIKDSE